MLGKTKIAKLSQDLGLNINNIIMLISFYSCLLMDKNNYVISFVYDIKKKEQQL